ncbi:hypothetical protein LshimejAT787_0805360 [Lyophyllum shimeji]|uniref:DUF6534 domain-containing protein n=1 Tax=Lyophyllum shimeji TaxID=47721 RepID=A0A9P3PQ97_LYOSH|nr:hypothetical protein LshimejAT787_0805360 [Lyophyllum shimeji]
MATPLHVQLDSKLGAAFLGNLVAGIFYGLTCMQSYTYFRSKKDRPCFRMVILLLWFLDTLQLALVTHGLYFYLVSSFGNILALLTPTWSFISQIYVTCASDIIVRCIFGCRVWRLVGRSKVLAACIAAVSVLTLGTGFAFATKISTDKLRFGGFGTISHFLYIALGSGVAVDLLIAVSLCWSLSKSRTGFKKTDSIVNTLMMYAINTGLLTTICAAACFITYAVWPHEFTFIAIYFSLPKLYLNSLLATLNSRDTLSGNISRVSDIPLSSISGNSNVVKASHVRRGQSLVPSWMDWSSFQPYHDTLFGDWLQAGSCWQASGFLIGEKVIELQDLDVDLVSGA